MTGDTKKKAQIKKYVRCVQEIKKWLLFNYERLSAKKWEETTQLAQLTTIYFFVLMARTGHTYQQIKQIKLYTLPFFQGRRGISSFLLSFLDYSFRFFRKRRNSSLRSMFRLVRAISFAPLRHLIARICSKKIAFNIFLICLLELTNELIFMYWEIFHKVEDGKYGIDLEHQMSSLANLAFYIASYLLSACVYVHCYIRSISDKTPTFPGFLQGIVRTAMSMSHYASKKGNGIST